MTGQQTPQDNQYGTPPETTDLRVPQGRISPRTASTIMSITPLVAAAVFFLCGFFLGGWAWAWVFFLAVPAVGYLLYGPNAFDKDAKG